MKLDFHTADNAETPHVSIFDAETEEVVCTVPIGSGRDAVNRAEQVAEVLMKALRDFDYAPAPKAGP